MSLNTSVPPGVITRRSRHTVSETLERLENIVRSKDLTIFTMVDHSGEAEKAGLKMQEAKLLIFGSPKAGPPLTIGSPLVALDLPLKALIWKDNEGRVWVSYNSTPYITNRYTLPIDLTKNIAGIDNRNFSAASPTPFRASTSQRVKGMPLSLTSRM